MKKKIKSPLKAIRLKCLDCSYNSSNEVRLCPVTDCILYPFRFGKNPFRKRKEYSTEELEYLREHMKNIRNLNNTK